MNDPESFVSSEANIVVDRGNNNHQGWGLINYPELEAIDQYTVETSVPDANFDLVSGFIGLETSSASVLPLWPNHLAAIASAKLDCAEGNNRLHTDA